MGFVDEEDLKRVKQTIQDFMADFTKRYTKAYGVALINSMLESQVEEKKEKDERQLVHFKITAPEKSGTVMLQSSVLKKWKPKFFKVQNDYSIAVSADEKAEKVLQTIDTWSYKATSFTESKDPKRKGGPQWVDAKDVAECQVDGCEAKAFSLMNRKHHCRTCGIVCCGKCSDHTYAMPLLGYSGPQKVCNTCWKQIDEKGAQFIVDVASKVQAEEDAKSAEAKKGEVDASAFWGIKLMSENRQPHFFRVGTKDERDEWLGVLEVCCKRAQPPVNPNPVQAAAFKASYMESCWQNSIWRSWRITGNEGEMLSDAVSYILNRDVVRDMLYKLKVPAALRRKAEDAVKSQVENSVRSGVVPAWEKCLEQVSKTEAPMREKAEPQLGPIGKARADLEAKLQEKIGEVMTKALDKVGKPVMEKAFPDIVTAITKSYAEAYKAFYSCVDDLVSAVNGSKTDTLKTFDAECKTIMRRCDGYGYYTRDAYWVIRDAENNALWELEKKFDSIYRYRVGSQIYESLQVLLIDAVWTINQDADMRKTLEADGEHGEAVKKMAKIVSKKLKNDSMLAVQKVLNDIFTTIIEPPFTKNVVENELVKKLPEEMDALIPDAVKDFISVQSSMDSVLSKSLADTITKFVDTGKGNVQNELEQFWLAVPQNK